MSLIGPALTLARREFTRFIRQPQRVIGSIGQPMLLWLFFGAGFSPSFSAPGMEGVSYLEYFYPGVLVMMMLFASIFSSITVIEDRDQGFLQGVLVAPVPRLAIALGKIGGGTSIAMLQAVLMLVAAPFMGFDLALGSWVAIVLALIATGAGFCALGLSIAWAMKSTAGFHAIMMVFLMPLWFLSGALFPVADLPTWLAVLIKANPVHHALTLIRMPFYAPPSEFLVDPAYLTSLSVYGVALVAVLILVVRRVQRRDAGVRLPQAA